jgi:hypothetical protein
MRGKTTTKTSSFLSRSAQVISFLLQHHIPKLSKYFRSAFRSVQVSSPYKSVLEMKHFTIFFLKLESNLCKRIILFLDQPKAEQYPLWAHCRIFEHSTWWFINQPLGLKICRVFKDFSVVVIMWWVIYNADGDNDDNDTLCSEILFLNLPFQHYGSIGWRDLGTARKRWKGS